MKSSSLHSLRDLRRGGRVEVRDELVHVVLDRAGIEVGRVHRGAEEGVDEHVGALGTGDHGRGGEEVVVVEDQDLPVGLPLPHELPADDVRPVAAAQPPVHDEADPRRDAHQDGVQPQAVALPVQEADDESELHERIDNVHHRDGGEALVDIEEALEGDVGDAQAGDDGGDLEHEHGVGLLPGRDVQVVVDVPQADGFQQQEQHPGAADVDDVADVEHPVRVPVGPAHLEVHEADRGRGQGAGDERDEGDGGPHGAVDAHVRRPEGLQHQPAGDESHEDRDRHPDVDDDRVAGDPYVGAGGHGDARAG